MVLVLGMALPKTLLLLSLSMYSCERECNNITFLKYFIKYAKRVLLSLPTEVQVGKEAGVKHHLRAYLSADQVEVGK